MPDECYSIETESSGLDSALFQRELCHFLNHQAPLPPGPLVFPGNLTSKYHAQPYLAVESVHDHSTRCDGCRHHMVPNLVLFIFLTTPFQIWNGTFIYSFSINIARDYRLEWASKSPFFIFFFSSFACHFCFPDSNVHIRKQPLRDFEWQQRTVAT